MTLINLNNFLNHAIGFEDVFRRFDRLPTINAGFPHYNIKKAGEDKYTLEMAVAGYKKSDINVTVADGVLSIEGTSSEDKEEFVDAIGDMVVVLTNMAHLGGTTIEECIDTAYKVISKRTGKMVNGTFVKDEK